MGGKKKENSKLIQTVNTLFKGAQPGRAVLYSKPIADDVLYRRVNNQKAALESNKVRQKSRV